MRSCRVCATNMISASSKASAEDMLAVQSITASRYRREDSGRWLAEIAVFGVRAEERTREDAISKAQGLAFRILADRIEQGKTLMGPSTISFSVAGRD